MCLEKSCKKYSKLCSTSGSHLTRVQVSCYEPDQFLGQYDPKSVSKWARNWSKWCRIRVEIPFLKPCCMTPPESERMSLLIKTLLPDRPFKTIWWVNHNYAHSITPFKTTKVNGFKWWINLSRKGTRRSMSVSHSKTSLI